VLCGCLEIPKYELITTPLSPPSQGGNRKDVISHLPLVPSFARRG